MFQTLKSIYHDLVSSPVQMALVQRTPFPLTDYTVKLKEAIDTLGPRYVLHPLRRVAKGNYEQTTMRCDVEATFKRVRKSQQKETQQ